MKETTNLTVKNINNLTALWTTAGVPFNAYSKTSDFEYCEIKDSEWPNRLWFHQPINQKSIDVIKKKLTETSTKITLPIWNISDKKEEVLLEQNGFNLKFEQIGMYLKPSILFEVKNEVTLKLVTNIEQAELWSTLFTKSFRYVISPKTIINTFKEVEYYIADADGIAVATAILYTTDKVTGIHSMGVPPEMRRKGYAEQIMKLLINKSINNKTELITLQASNMGKNIYLRLGFKEQFVIKNYILK